MIAQLSGTVARSTATYVVIDVHGVGYKVSVPVTVIETLPPPGKPITLVTHTLVREDDLSLFGFSDENELLVFELLLTVSGIGPKVALALLSALPVDSLAGAVANEDIRTLTRVPGIGAKTAQRLVLETRDKMAQLGFLNKVGRQASGTPKGPAAPASIADDVVSALVNLGYNKPEAARATDAAQNERKEAGEAVEFASLLRAALNRLTGGVR